MVFTVPTLVLGVGGDTFDPLEGVEIWQVIYKLFPSGHRVINSLVYDRQE